MTNMNTTNRPRLIGGSKGDSMIGSKGGGLFAPGVRVVYPKQNSVLRGRVMPAFNVMMNQADSLYKTSIMPYRDRNAPELDKQTQTPAFTPFFVNIQSHRFFGAKERSFLSPRTLQIMEGATAEQTADPLIDLYNGIKRTKDEDLIKLYLKKADDKKNSRPKVPLPSKQAVMNFYHEGENGAWETSLLVLSRGAMDHMKEQLAWPVPSGKTPHDPNWPEFLFGDITDPENGLLATVSLTKLENISAHCLHFSTKKYSLDGAVVKKIPASELANRYDILSLDVLVIPTYQQIVDIIVQETDIDLELVKRYCGHAANVGNRIHGRPTKDDQELEDEDLDESQDDLADDAVPAQQSYPTPPAPPAPPAPVAPPAPPAPSVAPAAEEKFWVIHSGSPNRTPVQMTKSELQSIVNDGHSADVMTLDQKSGWKKPADFGITPVAATPAPPAPPAAPVPPAPPEAPAANAGTVTVVTGGDLTPEELAELESYKARNAAAEKDPSQRLKPKETVRMVALMNRLNKK